MIEKNYYMELCNYQLKQYIEFLCLLITRCSSSKLAIKDFYQFEQQENIQIIQLEWIIYFKENYSKNTIIFNCLKNYSNELKESIEHIYNFYSLNIPDWLNNLLDEKNDITGIYI